VSVIYSLLSYDKYEKFDKMPPKAVISSLVVIISGWADTSIAESLDADLQLIIRGQL